MSYVGDRKEAVLKQQASVLWQWIDAAVVRIVGAHAHSAHAEGGKSVPAFRVQLSDAAFRVLRRFVTVTEEADGTFTVRLMNVTAGGPAVGNTKDGLRIDEVADGVLLVCGRKRFAG